MRTYSKSTSINEEICMHLKKRTEKLSLKSPIDFTFVSIIKNYENALTGWEGQTIF